MAVSLPVMVNLASGEDADVVAGPCVLTDLIVTEMTGAAAAMVLVAGAEDAVAVIAVGVAAGQSALWHGRLVLPNGINVAAQAGDVGVTVGYY